MDTVLRLAALCLLGALLAVLLRRGGGELALLLVLAVCGVAVALLLEPLGQLRDFWEEASAWGQLPEQLFQPLLKTVCIALIIPLLVVRHRPALRDEARRRFHM